MDFEPLGEVVVGEIVVFVVGCFDLRKRGLPLRMKALMRRWAKNLPSII